MSERHTRAYTVTMTVRARSDANMETVRSLVDDLEWVGGCRERDDPAFASLKVVSMQIKRNKDKDKR